MPSVTFVGEGEMDHGGPCHKFSRLLAQSMLGPPEVQIYVQYILLPSTVCVASMSSQ